MSALMAGPDPARLNARELEVLLELVARVNPEKLPAEEKHLVLRVRQAIADRRKIIVSNQ